MAYLLEESCACALVILLLGASLFIAATIFLVANQTLRAGLSAASAWAKSPSRRRMLRLSGVHKRLQEPSARSAKVRAKPIEALTL